MKQIIILISILLLVSSFSIAQINCGTQVDAQYLQELDNSLITQQGCEDSFDSYDLDQGITYNLMLKYAKLGSGFGAFTQIELDDIEANIDNVYNQQNIYFNYVWINLDCDECLTHLNQWPAHLDSDICIQGNVVHHDITTGVPFSGLAGENSGKFWANSESVAHELGHSVGLLHTHKFPKTAKYSKELVTRVDTPNANDPCNCNCLKVADRICDTPPDPYPVESDSFTLQEFDLFVNAMFDPFDCEFDNEDMVTDSCGDLYEVPNLIAANNVMSYHCNDQNGVPRLTQGQNLRIRFSTDQGNGTFKYQQDPSEMDFTAGLTVNVPTTINADEAYNGDIIVNSDLTIQNCVIELTEGHKIIVNAGANLNIANATVRTYTGGICYFPMEGKKEWEGIETVPSTNDLTSIAVYANSTIDVSEAGIYSIENDTELRFLNLIFNNSTINGPAINLTNTIGSQKLLKSNFDHTVSVTDNFYLQVLGCSFDLSDQNEESCIKSENTYLAVEASDDGVRSSFKNCGHGVEFISSSAHSCEISGSDFDQVLTGINAVSTAGFFSAHDCTILMRDPSGTIGFGNGIFLDNFIDFEIYDNDAIVGIGGGTQVGIKLLKTGLNDNPNLIINNTIKDCSLGIQSAGAELGNFMSGVEFECNTMINIQNDNFHTGKIGPHQGRGNETGNGRPAGNKFDGSPYCINTPNFCYSDFNYEGGGFTDIKTYHYRNEDLENIEYYNDGSEFTGIAIFTTNELTNGELPQCIYPPLPYPPNPITRVNTTRIDSLDGGDTDGSIFIITTDSDNAPNIVITIIIGNSPWVSVPVVQTLFDYSPYYTENQIAQIIIENPAVLDDNYINAIVFESGTFSAANQQLMIQAYQAGDTRMDYEGSLVDPILEGTLLIKNTMHIEVDNETFNQTTIRAALVDKISYTKLYQTVESYLLEQDYQGALSTLNAKQVFENFDPHLLLEKTKYAEIIQMEANLYALGEGWSKLLIADQNRLIAIANNYHGVATIKARNILKIYFDMQFGALPTEPTYSPLQFAPSAPRSFENENTVIKVFPNPAYNVLNFVLNDNVEMCTFRLLSIDGKMIKSQTLLDVKNKIDLSGVDKGIYFYEITQGGMMLSSSKIIILE